MIRKIIYNELVLIKTDMRVEEKNTSCLYYIHYNMRTIYIWYWTLYTAQLYVMRRRWEYIIIYTRIIIYVSARYRCMQDIIFWSTDSKYIILYYMLCEVLLKLFLKWWIQWYYSVWGDYFNCSEHLWFRKALTLCTYIFY